MVTARSCSSVIGTRSAGARHSDLVVPASFGELPATLPIPGMCLSVRPFSARHEQRAPGAPVGYLTEHKGLSQQAQGRKMGRVADAPLQVADAALAQPDPLGHLLPGAG